MRDTCHKVLGTLSDNAQMLVLTIETHRQRGGCRGLLGTRLSSLSKRQHVWYADCSFNETVKRMAVPSSARMEQEWWWVLSPTARVIDDVKMLEVQWELATCYIRVMYNEWWPTASRNFVFSLPVSGKQKKAGRQEKNARAALGALPFRIECLAQQCVWTVRAGNGAVCASQLCGQASLTVMSLSNCVARNVNWKLFI